VSYAPSKVLKELRRLDCDRRLFSGELEELLEKNVVEPQVMLEVGAVGAEVDRSASEALKRSCVVGEVLRDVNAFESENAVDRLELDRRVGLFIACSGEVERLFTMLFRLLREECGVTTGGVSPVEYGV
jgi:hypothetical protein